MCRWSDAVLNCVSRKIRLMSELMQLLIGMSTRRYFPASGTAGLQRSMVRGARRVPRPPPMITARTFFWVVIRRYVFFGPCPRWAGPDILANQNMCGIVGYVGK